VLGNVNAIMIMVFFDRIYRINRIEEFRNTGTHRNPAVAKTMTGRQVRHDILRMLNHGCKTPRPTEG
jgi:hypothetical protein